MEPEAVTKQRMDLRSNFVVYAPEHSSDQEKKKSPTSGELGIYERVCGRSTQHGERRGHWQRTSAKVPLGRDI